MKKISAFTTSVFFLSLILAMLFTSDSQAQRKARNNHSPDERYPLTRLEYLVLHLQANYQVGKEKYSISFFAKRPATLVVTVRHSGAMSFALANTTLGYFKGVAAVQADLQDVNVHIEGKASSTSPDDTIVLAKMSIRP